MLFGPPFRLGRVIIATARRDAGVPLHRRNSWDRKPRKRAALLASGTVVSFDDAGQISFPSLVASTGTGTFVGESSPIPNYNLQSSAGPTLHPCTFAAPTSATSEILGSSQVEALIRRALLDAAAVALDAWLFSTADGVPGESQRRAPSANSCEIQRLLQ